MSGIHDIDPGSSNTRMAPCQPYQRCQPQGSLLITSVHCPVLLQEGVTPIYLAAEAGHLEIVRVLLKAGADFNAPQQVTGKPESGSQ
jgi:ankyrin repeat protein